MPTLRGLRNRLLHYLPTPRGPVYVFHHLPKTGGATVNRLLARWFYRIRDYPSGDPEDEGIDRYGYGPPLDPSGLARGDCLSGHWGSNGNRPHERYPEVFEEDRFRVLTLLRDPLQTQLSLLHFAESRGHHTYDTRDKFFSWLLHRPNYLTWRIAGGVPEEPEKLLDRYWFVGITDEMQRSMDLLADHMGKPRLEVGRHNRTERRYTRDDLPRLLVDAFRKWYWADYRLYEAARERLERWGGLRPVDAD